VKGTIAAAMAVLGMALVLGVALAPSASAGAQRVENAIWADGRLWGTIGTPAVLPGNAPLGSFDKLFMFTNSNNPAGQKPVSEAGPGNPAYNGGRWASFTATWTAAGFAAHGTVPVLTSYADVIFHVGMGHLLVTQGHPTGGPGFFECPLIR